MKQHREKNITSQAFARLGIFKKAVFRIFTGMGINTLRSW